MCELARRRRCATAFRPGPDSGNSGDEALTGPGGPLAWCFVLWFAGERSIRRIGDEDPLGPRQRCGIRGALVVALLELVLRLAERARELRDLGAAEDQQHDGEDDEQLGGSETHDGSLVGGRELTGAGAGDADRERKASSATPTDATPAPMRARPSVPPVRAKPDAAAGTASGSFGSAAEERGHGTDGLGRRDRHCLEDRQRRAGRGDPRRHLRGTGPGC